MIIGENRSVCGVQRVLHSESVAKNTHSRGKDQKPEKSELSMEQELLNQLWNTAKKNVTLTVPSPE